MPWSENRYHVHGEWIEVRTDSRTIAAAAEEVLGSVQRGPVLSSPDDRPPLEIELHGVASTKEVAAGPATAAKPIQNTPDAQPDAAYTLYRQADCWWIDFHACGRMRLDLAGGRMEGWLVGPEANPPDWAASFVLSAAIELLRTRGVYAIHAAGVERDGRGIIIAAPSGRGKTTACLGLARSGYRMLSDDHPLLRAAESGMELLPFPGRVAVTPQTAAWLPELAAAEAAMRQDSVKRSFCPQEVLGTRWAGPCRPALLVFPRLVDWPESFLEPLPRLRALEELLPQTMLVLDRQLAARQFQTFARLVQSVPCYRLHFGHDVLALPELFDRVLEKEFSTIGRMEA